MKLGLRIVMLTFRPTFQYNFTRTTQTVGGVANFATFSDVINSTSELRIFQEVSVAGQRLKAKPLKNYIYNI